MRFNFFNIIFTLTLYIIYWPNKLPLGDLHFFLFVQTPISKHWKFTQMFFVKLSTYEYMYVYSFEFSEDLIILFFKIKFKWLIFSWCSEQPTLCHPFISLCMSVCVCGVHGAFLLPFVIHEYFLIWKFCYILCIIYLFYNDPKALGLVFPYYEIFFFHY